MTTHANPRYVMLIAPSRPPTIEEQVYELVRSRAVCDFELSMPQIWAMKRLRKKGLVLRSMEKDCEFGWTWRAAS